jgi:sugar (pentulose or hexulose) kinase
MVRSGIYTSYEEAARETLRTSTVTEPDESTTRSYAEAKERWKELYLEITELTEEGKF